ncbi:MAG: 30S ribosome-binding factor RbfA [Candidatus Omnitrophica bacterium]|nr:30S ribosome-binding factor RbfA [Candidatus Omnitrophota bacterium]
MSRVQKVAEALKREISNIIHDELKDPRIGFITVLRIELSSDLKFARIYYSVLGNSKEKESTASALENAKGFIRREVAQRLTLKFVPEIVFKEDKSVEESIFLEEEIRRLREEKDGKGIDSKD